MPCRVWPEVVPAVSAEVERCDHGDERGVQGAGAEELPAGDIRAAGAAPGAVDEEDLQLPGGALERLRAAPREADQPEGRHQSQQGGEVLRSGIDNKYHQTHLLPPL